MTPVNLVFLLESAALGFYIVGGVLLLISFIQWANANDEYENTTFELLREKAGERRHGAFLRLSTLSLLVAVVFVVQLLVAPRLRTTAASVQPTPTPPPVVSATPAPLPTSGEADVIGGASVQATPVSEVSPTPTQTPIGTIIPDAPPLEGCDRPEAILQIPANGMEVREPFEVIGTAFGDDFQSYRLELRGPSTGGNFAVLLEAVDQVTPFGRLGDLTPAAFEPGAYQLRLVVLGTDGLMRAACTVNIVIVG
jgi:hypothetical protein